MADALGDRMKEYEMEYAGRKFLPPLSCPIMARIDGRCFSKFTRDMGRPYDRGLSALMINTTSYLVQETNANCGYTQSDEITLTWQVGDPKSDIFFGGRVQKMVSILAAMTSVYFSRNLHRFFSPCEPLAERLPHFDARVWTVPSLEEGANCFLWREQDATKNSISMAAQGMFSHKQLFEKNTKDMQEMLFQKGVNWNDYPDFFKRGSYVQRSKVTRAFSCEELERLPAKHEARLNPSLVVERTEYLRVDMPPLGKVVNRVGVLYKGEQPVTGEVEQDG